MPKAQLDAQSINAPSLEGKILCVIYYLLTINPTKAGGGLHRPPLFLKTHISVTPNPFFMKFYDFSSNFIYFQMQKKFFSNFEQGCRGNQFVGTW